MYYSMIFNKFYYKISVVGYQGGDLGMWARLPVLLAQEMVLGESSLGILKLVYYHEWWSSKLSCYHCY